MSQPQLRQKKIFDAPPDLPESEELPKDTDAIVMIPMPQQFEEINGRFFITREAALNMAVTLILSAK